MATAFDFVTAEHFLIAPDRTAAQTLFKRSVVMVEVEVFSYCNRRCWFCPEFPELIASPITCICRRRFIPAFCDS